MAFDMEQHLKEIAEKARINRKKFDWLINPTKYGVKKYFDEYRKAYYHNYPEDAVDNRNRAFRIPVGQAEDRLFLLLLENNPNRDELLKNYEFDIDDEYNSKLYEAERYFEIKQEKLFRSKKQNINDYLTLRDEIQDFINELKSKISLFDLFVEHFYDVTEVNGVKTIKWERLFSENDGKCSVWRAIYRGHLFPKSEVRYEDYTLRNKNGDVYSPIRYIVSTPYLMEEEAHFDPIKPDFWRTINTCIDNYNRYTNDYKLLKEHIEFFKDKSINDVSIYKIDTYNEVVNQIKQDLKNEQKNIEETKKEEKRIKASTAGKLIELSKYTIKPGAISYGDSGVYLIVDNKTLDFYIGESQNMEFRKKTHIGELALGEHHSKLMQEHFNKYGV